MAQIITAWDMSGGDKTSTVVATPNNTNISWKTSGVSEAFQAIELQVKVVVDGEDSHIAKDDTGKQIILKVIGNQSGNVSLYGLNAASLTIQADVPSGSDGDLDVWALKSS